MSVSIKHRGTDTQRHYMTPTAFSIFSGFACGALFINALLLILLNIPQQSEWRSFRCARICVAIACVLLVGCYGADAITEHHSSEIEKIAWYGISALQAVLFTSTCVVFVAPRRRLMPLIVSHLLLAAAVVMLNVGLYVYSSESTRVLRGITSLVVYALQIVCLCAYFHRSYSRSLLHLEDVYDDEFADRLFWVKRLFYVAFAVGIMASFGMFSFGYVQATLFEGSVIVVYSLIVNSFMNYYSKARFVVDADRDVMPSTADSLTEENEVTNFTQLQKRIDVWLARKGYLTADFSVDEISAELGVNRIIFAQYFSSVLGTNFRSWRIALRIAEAERLLREHPDIPTSDLIPLCGYKDRSNFHKHFQKQTGHSLNEYRLLCQDNPQSVNS